MWAPHVAPVHDAGGAEVRGPAVVVRNVVLRGHGGGHGGGQGAAAGAAMMIRLIIRSGAVKD